MYVSVHIYITNYTYLFAHICIYIYVYVDMPDPKDMSVQHMRTCRACDLQVLMVSIIIPTVILLLLSVCILVLFFLPVSVRV